MKDSRQKLNPADDQQTGAGEASCKEQEMIRSERSRTAAAWLIDVHCIGEAGKEWIVLRGSLLKEYRETYAERLSKAFSIQELDCLARIGQWIRSSDTLDDFPVPIEMAEELGARALAHLPDMLRLPDIRRSKLSPEERQQEAARMIESSEQNLCSETGGSESSEKELTYSGTLGRIVDWMISVMSKLYSMNGYVITCGFYIDHMRSSYVKRVRREFSGQELEYLNRLRQMNESPGTYCDIPISAMEASDLIDRALRCITGFGSVAHKREKLKEYLD